MDFEEAKKVSLQTGFRKGGTGGLVMCGENKKCQKPKELKGKPEECSTEQVKKCHGDVSTHPCVKPDEKKD